MLRVPGKRGIYCSGNEVGILAMGGIPITSVEDSHNIVVDAGERFEETDEAMLVIHLRAKKPKLVSAACLEDVLSV